MCCAYLILLSEYFRCVPGNPRIPEVSEVVWEFRSNLVYCATTALDTYPLHPDKIHYIQMVTSVYICGTTFCEPWQSTLLALSLLPSTLLPANFCFHPS